MISTMFFETFEFIVLSQNVYPSAGLSAFVTNLIYIVLDRSLKAFEFGIIKL